MKNLLICLLLCSNCFSAFCSRENKTNIIKSCSVESYYVQNGTKGMLISFEYCFPEKDSLIINPYKSRFKIAMQLFERNDPISHNYGFQEAMPGDVFTYHFSLMDIKTSKNTLTVSQFIPYAALKLPPGEKLLGVVAKFSGTDGNENKYSEELEKKLFKATLPPTNAFTISINSIEVNAFNEKGQAWDYSLFKSSAPDLKVTILLGGLPIWSKTGKDSYKFGNMNEHYQTRFIISSGDEVRLRVVDNDLTIDDFIIEWRMTTSDKSAGGYVISGTYDNIKICKIAYTLSQTLK